MNRNNLTTVLFTSAAMTVTGIASAATTNLSAYQSNAVYPSDTRPNGSATDSMFTIDGTHSSVLLTSTDGLDTNEKVAPFFYSGSLGTPIGTLGDLARGGLTADWELNSRDATVPSYVDNIAAFRILVDGPTPGTTAEIVWENAYQTSPTTYAAGTGYDNIDIGSGKFWVRYLSQNYGQGDNGPINPLTLSDLAAGDALTGTSPTFSDSTNVYGLQVSIGSGAGNYSAYVSDIEATFTSTPEPSSIALLGLAGFGMLKRRR